MSVWDKTTPLGTDNISSGDDRIRELKEALEDALSSHGTFPGGNPSTAPIYVPLGIVATTEMVFYQAAAPTGWTINSAIDDRVLLNDSAAGGTTGGSWDSLSHVHNVPTHTHGVGTYQFETFDWNYSGATGTFRGFDSNGATDNMFTMTQSTTSGVATGSDKDAVAISQSSSDTSYTKSGTGVSGSGSAFDTDAGTVTHGSAEHNWAKVIIAAKD